MVAELQRLGARLLAEDEVAALSAAAFDDGAVQLQTLGQSCLNLGALAGFEAEIDDKVLLAPLPTDLEALLAHPLAAEKLMPVLGLVRSPSVEHAIAVAEAITEHGGLGHTSAVYATDEDVDRGLLGARAHRAASSSTRRPRSARSAASTTR